MGEGEGRQKEEQRTGSLQKGNQTEMLGNAELIAIRVFEKPQSAHKTLLLGTFLPRCYLIDLQYPYRKKKKKKKT